MVQLTAFYLLTVLLFLDVRLSSLMNYFPQRQNTAWYLEICVANPLYKDAQSILEIYHVKICFLLIHNPTVGYIAARKTLLHVVYNDGYILVFHFTQQ